MQNVIGSKIHYFDELTSTNNKAKELAIKGEPEGSCVIAKTQTHGRGRHNRIWISDIGGLYLSIILRPKLTPPQILLLTLLTGVVVYKTLIEFVNKSVNISLKWPNDVLLNDRKIAGILTETSTTLDKINYAIVGIGINVNNDVKNIERVIFPATSLKDELKKEINIDELLKRLLSNFEYYYFEKDYHEIISEWKKYSSTLNRKVIVKTIDEELIGKAIDIDKNGFLLVLVAKKDKILEIKEADIIYI